MNYNVAISKYFKLNFPYEYTPLIPKSTAQNISEHGFFF